MIISRLRGGLGNQMFQYAFGKKLTAENGTTLKLDHSWFHSPGAIDPKREYDLGMFSMKPGSASRFEIFLARIFGVTVKENAGSPATISANNAYLDGFWQSPKYLAGIEAELRKDFRFASPVMQASAEIEKKIVSSESVCINVRRTDFVSEEKFIGIPYYKEAIEFIRARFPDAAFFIFSDDILWCEENMSFLPGAIFIGHEHTGPQFANYLHLMALCKHFIIPNSTFAWWAAWLSGNPKKIVIAPKNWLVGKNQSNNDIVPSSWTRI